MRRRPREGRPPGLAAALADRYRIERELGAGGMATVYLAADLKHDRKVAIKVLKPELAAVLGAERFVQEIKTTAQLQHPHILPLFDSGRAVVPPFRPVERGPGGEAGSGGEAFLYYVMPYIEGETVREKLNRETQLGIEEAVRITTEVADALDYAHRQGVIHRDIKPENILLHDGRPLVMDFGIALAVRAAAGGRMTETGLSLGTPHYMSPEQATADRDITARSDVYSLGSVLYEMLTGEPPHLGTSAQQIIMKIIAEPVPPVTTLRKSVPPNVAAALAQALEKLPADRFESAKGFAAALTNPSFPTKATAPAAMSLTALPPFRLTALLALAALAALAAWGWLRPRPVAPLIRYSMLMSGVEAVSSATPLVGNRLALSPDGNALAYVAGDGTAAGPGLWVRRRDALHATPLAGASAARHPFFAPDGEHIGYFGPDGALYVVGVSGAPPHRLGSELFDNVLTAAWGRDGYIYATSRDGRLVRIPADGGDVEYVTAVDSAQGERAHIYPQVLPNGHGILITIRSYQGGRDNDRIAVVDLRSQQRRPVVAGVASWYARSGHLLYVTSDGELMAAPFDQARLQTKGPAKVVIDSVGLSRLGAELTLSASGTLMYLKGTAGFSVQPVWVDRQGKAVPVDSGWTFTTSSIYSALTLSPDGSRLIVGQSTAGTQQLFVKRLPRGPNMQLTFEGQLNSRASWTPDGRSVEYVSDRTGTNTIWRRVADGSAPAEQVAGEHANEGFLTPDESWFIYRGISPDRHIYARRTKGDTSTLIVARAQKGEDYSPTLAPNGRWIAYTSTESGQNQVYVRPFPDVTRGKTQVSSSGGSEPRWSRDGRELFFRNGANEIVSARIGMNGSTFTVESTQALFSMREFLPENVYQPTYDVSPDGRRFVMGRQLEGTAGEQLIVVENFVQHLEELLRP